MRPPRPSRRPASWFISNILGSLENRRSGLACGAVGGVQAQDVKGKNRKLTVPAGVRVKRVIEPLLEGLWVFASGFPVLPMVPQHGLLLARHLGDDGYVSRKIATFFGGRWLGHILSMKDRHGPERTRLPDELAEIVPKLLAFFRPPGAIIHADHDGNNVDRKRKRLNSSHA